MADNMYTVKITAQAEKQLGEIIKYVASELKAPKAALRLLNEIERSISSLSQFPQRVCVNRRRTVAQQWYSQNACTKLFRLFLD